MEGKRRGNATYLNPKFKCLEADSYGPQTFHLKTFFQEHIFPYISPPRAPIHPFPVTLAARCSLAQFASNLMAKGPELRVLGCLK